MKMTLHKILSELKTLDKRIEKAIKELDPVTVMRGSKLVSSSLSEEEFKTKALGQYQSVNDLINRKFILRSALLNANCNIKVKVLGNEYSIYQAIEMKEIIRIKKIELSKLQESLRTANILYQRTVDRNDKDLEQQIQFFCQSSKEESKPEIVKQLTEQMNQLNGVKLLDPIDIQKEIDSLDKMTDEFDSEIDAALSEINSITTVDIED